MFVIIVGGGKTGSHLAQQLIEEGHQVKLVESRTEIIDRLAGEIPSEVLVSGDGSSPAILENAGIRQAEVLAAVTGEDETNLVVTTLGRFEFNVPRTIARVNNPKNEWLFTADMGVDARLNQTDILAKLIKEEMSLGDMITLIKLRRGEYSVVEEKLLPGSSALGLPLRELPLPETCVIAAVIRAGKVITPRGNLEFEVGDEILAVVDTHSMQVLKELFGPPEK